jgi:hypothetical protein
MPSPDVDVLNGVRWCGLAPVNVAVCVHGETVRVLVRPTATEATVGELVLSPQAAAYLADALNAHARHVLTTPGKDGSP